MKLQLFLPALLLVLLASCSGLPNESRNETDMKTFLETVSKKDMELVQFIKKDGLKRESSGVKYYVVTFEATIRYNNKGYLIRNTSFFNDNLNYIFDFHVGEPVSYSYNFGRLITIKKHETLNICGDITYYKSENGWNINKIIINKYKEANP